MPPEERGAAAQLVCGGSCCVLEGSDPHFLLILRTSRGHKSLSAPHNVRAFDSLLWYYFNNTHTHEKVVLSYPANEGGQETKVRLQG